MLMMAAESISEERKRPDLKVLKPSAVSSRLGLLKAVEGSRHCVACVQIVNRRSFIPIKRSFGRVSVGAPETGNRELVILPNLLLLSAVPRALALVSLSWQ